MTKKGKRLALPTDLYDFSPVEQPTIITPGNNQFGGADISLATDAKGTEFVAFTAREIATDIFGFVIWNLSLNKKVPYQPFCNARGELNEAGQWIAWNNNDFHRGPIPGFAPFPSLVALQAQIDALRTQLGALSAQMAGSPPTIANGVLTIWPQGPPLEGGEIRMADGMGGWITIDGRAGNLRVVLTGAQTLRVWSDGALVEDWPK